MTYAEREEIFSKEVLTNKDFQKLFGIAASEASQIIGTIKRRVGDRLGVKGKVHVQDYLDAYELEGARYLIKED